MDKSVSKINGYEIKDAKARNDISQISGQITELNEVDTALRNDVDSLLSKDTNIDGRLAEIETDVANNTSKLGTLESQSNTNKSNITKNTNAITKVEGDINTLTTANTNNTNAIGELTTKVNSVKSIYQAKILPNTIPAFANFSISEDYFVGEKLGIDTRGHVGNISNETIKVKVSSSFTYYTNTCTSVWLKLCKYGVDESNNMKITTLFSVLHYVPNVYVTCSLSPMVIELKPGEIVAWATSTLTGGENIVLNQNIECDPGYLLVEEI